MDFKDKTQGTVPAGTHTGVTVREAILGLTQVALGADPPWPTLCQPQAPPFKFRPSQRTRPNTSVFSTGTIKSLRRLSCRSVGRP